jgi:hypothetical protein
MNATERKLINSRYVELKEAYPYFSREKLIHILADCHGRRPTTIEKTIKSP